MRTAPGKVVLAYKRRSDDELWQNMEDPVSITWTACHYGGVRAWFICPVPGCQRRVAILYIPEEYPVLNQPVQEYLNAVKYKASEERARELVFFFWPRHYGPRCFRTPIILRRALLNSTRLSDQCVPAKCRRGRGKASTSDADSPTTDEGI